MRYIKSIFLKKIQLLFQYRYISDFHATILIHFLPVFPSVFFVSRTWFVNCLVPVGHWKVTHTLSAVDLFKYVWPFSCPQALKGQWEIVRLVSILTWTRKAVIPLSFSWRRCISYRNQWTGFYMICPSVMKELKVQSCKLCNR